MYFRILLTLQFQIGSKVSTVCSYVDIFHSVIKQKRNNRSCIIFRLLDDLFFNVRLVCVEAEG